MANKKGAAKAGAEGPKTKYYITQVVEEFDSKKEAEVFLADHDLGEDEIIVKGRQVETRMQVKL